MPVEIENGSGKIHISDEVIAVLAGSAALECYGLVGMATRKQIKDGIAELLRRENLGRGVEIRRDQGGLHIDLYIVVMYGTKISEVAHNIQVKVKYEMEQIVGLDVDSVNIIVQGVRVSR